MNEDKVVENSEAEVESSIVNEMDVIGSGVIPNNDNEEEEK